MNREEKKELRRQRIVAEARRLFEARGVENTPMEEIAAAAGCTRRTLYAYFQTWEELALTVDLEDLAERWSLQLAAMTAADQGLERMGIWARTYFAFVKSHQQHLRLQTFWDYRGIRTDNLSPGFVADMDVFIDGIADAMRDIFRQGQQDGSIAPDLDADQTLGQFAYALRAVMNRGLFDRHGFADLTGDAIVLSFIDLFLRGIAAAPGRRA